ncbi:hypothetical protein M885DRAFT_580435 [Pelagophyceae sp. CCMP2097]|nr:hypothetical protein M885DRAFT_580435 [Pelagophyceae sp. CCMP2097]
MKSMAMLDGLDLQQLMSGGDLHGTPPGAVRAPSDCPGGGRPAYSSPLTQAADASPAPQASSLRALSALATQDSAERAERMRRIASSEQLAATAEQPRPLQRSWAAPPLGEGGRGAPSGAKGAPAAQRRSNRGTLAKKEPSSGSSKREREHARPRDSDERARRVPRRCGSLDSEDEDDLKGAVHHGACLQDGEGVGLDTEKARKDIRRERNREHARISRERKRRKLEYLQEENDQLRRKSSQLLEALAAAERELSQLREWSENAGGLRYP